MTAELAQSRHSGDPARAGFGAVRHEPAAPVTPSADAAFAPDPDFQPVAEALTTTAMLEVSRKIKRLTETREIRVRTTHRRRKVIARSGVLAGFGLAMVVYPVMGNVVSYSSGIENVPGVVLGETPTTGYALLGNGNSLIPTVIAVPTVDEQAAAIAATDPTYIVSTRLPDCQPKAEGDYSVDNGHLTADDLCLLWDGNYLRADAALAYDRLNDQFRAKFGRDICIYEGYRSYEDQIRMKALRGYLAAPPGLSMHGLGIAFDLCIGDYSGEPKAWLDEAAPAFGFVNPPWAQGRKFEPWHWEYKPATDALGVYEEGGDFYAGVADGGGDSPAPGSTAEPTPAPSPEPSPSPAAAAAP